ncbi:hypothetical protein VZT92_023841 [Zoarces viviparus]|uniref:Uncharacterized protein n=1 Tax=Zoarces viviparus TaxID=48416 RepID=A0AAW1E9K7_ZOAVI
MFVLLTLLSLQILPLTPDHLSFPHLVLLTRSPLIPSPGPPHPITSHSLTWSSSPDHLSSPHLVLLTRSPLIPSPGPPHLITSHPLTWSSSPISPAAHPLISPHYVGPLTCTCFCRIVLCVIGKFSSKYL